MSGAGKPAGARGSLYLRWIFANAVGEAVGLGLTALVGATAVLYAGGETSGLVTLALALLAIVAGALVEGTVVGTAQWWVLRDPLPLMPWRTWTVATGAGAFVAWTLGMVPSTVVSLGETGGQAGASAEPSIVVVFGLAFLMGLVLGPVLGFAQWFALRRFVDRAVLWLPANALAWAFGMLVIFAGVELAMSGEFGPGTVLVLAATLLCAGAIVGAVHGLALVRLLGSRPMRTMQR